jgi:hypothetical protein
MPLMPANFFEPTPLKQMLVNIENAVKRLPPPELKKEMEWAAAAEEIASVADSTAAAVRERWPALYHLFLSLEQELAAMKKAIETDGDNPPQGGRLGIRLERLHLLASKIGSYPIPPSS